MKEYWVKLKEWWTNLAVREKQAVTAGGIAFGIFIIYQFIWSPALDHVSNMRKRIETQQKLLVWMQAADKEIHKAEGQAKDKNQPMTPVAFLSYMQKKIEHDGLEQSLTQLKQSTNETVVMQFKKVDFDKLVRMLTSMVKEQNVSISQMSALADNEPGIVDADVTVKLG